MGLYCIASVQHTGTWFVIDVVRSLVSAHSSFSGFSYPQANQPVADYVAGWKRNGGGCVVHIYNDDDHIVEYENIKRLVSEGHKIIIPIRDPMLSLISRENRYSVGSPHEYILDGFLFLRDIYNDFNDNVFFFPIDLYNKRKQRKLLITRLSGFLGILPPDNNVKKILGGWDEPVNTNTDESSLKSTYLDGAVNEVVDFFVNKGSQFITKSKSIKPFLVSIGYTKLPWYEIVE